MLHRFERSELSEFIEFPFHLGKTLMFLSLQFGTFLKRNIATAITQTAVKILLHYHFYFSFINVSKLLFYMFIFSAFKIFLHRKLILYQMQLSDL